MKNKTIIQILFAFVLSILLLFVTNINTKYNNPKEVYRVYLSGRSIGIIESKKELEEYIDKEQSDLKEKYHVKKVYAPNDLDILKEITYNEDLSTTKDIYDKIKEKSHFSIEGYKVIIDPYERQGEHGVEKLDSQELYVLDNKVFIDSVNNFTKSFLTEEEIEKYKDGVRETIVDTGSVIENIYTEPNEFRVIKENIPANKKIYTDVDDLTKYLLFGGSVSSDKYTVKEGDTIDSVAFANKMSTTEFLVLNTNLNSEKDLLFPGQKVTVGVLNPQFLVKTTEEEVVNQEIRYKTTVKYDDTKMYGYTNVEQQGKNGLHKITKKIYTANGEVIDAIEIKTEEVIPMVEEIIIRGGGFGSTSAGGYGPVGDAGHWQWPTKSYTISSGFGYRWGVLHDAIDITGQPGSPIYAANGGVVVEAGNKWPNGIYAIINHNNGYETVYAHMSFMYVKAGDTVNKGQVIGGMGRTGLATGVHLHFSIYRGKAFRGTPLNPLNFY